MEYLVAEDPVRKGQRIRATHLSYAAIVNCDRQAAGIGAIKGTYAGSLLYCHDWL